MTAADDLAVLRERVSETTAAEAHPEVTARLRDWGPPAADDACVVVVGEKKRGKSSLINALLKRPDLFPVDVDIATACYLGASFGERERAMAYGAEAPDGIEIALADIGAWASVEGNRVPGSSPPQPIHPGVTAVTVELPNPLLSAGLTIIDTPGVGGLEAGHTDITLAILRGADSLLFIVDPDSGLRRSELEFLVAATERVPHVAFVMTKVDRYPSWRDVLNENRSRLAESAPAWADSPWFDVSNLVAYDAIEADEDGDSVEAKQLWAESGFDRLEDYLRDQLSGRAATLRENNALHQLRSVVRALEEAEQIQLAAATADPELRQRLARQQSELTALLADDATWPGELRSALEELKASLQKQFRTNLRTLRADLHDHLQVGQLSASQLPAELDARLRGMWIELTVTLRDKSTAILVLLAGELANGGSDVLSRDLEFPERLAELPPLTTLAARDKDFAESLDEFMPVAFAAGGAVTLLSTVLALMNPLTAVAIGLGAGLARRNAQVEQRNMARDRAGGVAYVQRVLEQAADDIGEDLQRAIADTRDRCEATVREAIQHRRSELESQVRTLKQQVRSDEAAESMARREAEQRLAELKDVHAALDAIATHRGA
jgi:GTPase SAR1 family protein